MFQSDINVSFWRVPRVVLLFFLFLFTCTHNFQAQVSSSLLDSTITITFNNQRVTDALEQMELQAHITFSYKSGLFNEKKIINGHFVKEPIERILQKIISNDSISFSAIGRQIAFYVPRNTKFVTVEKVVTKMVEVPVLRKVFIHDTVVVNIRDTITIVRSDTVLVPDTVMVSDTKGRYSFSTFLNVNSVTPKWKLEEREYEPIYQDLIDAESNGSITRIGAMGNFHYKNYSVSTGLGLSFLRNKASYNFTSVITDSAKILDYQVNMLVDSFITDSFTIDVPGQDPIRKYLYERDTTLSVENKYKTDTIDFKHIGTNGYTFVTIPIYFNWEKKISPKNTFFLNAGILVDFLISTKGYSLSQSPYKELVSLSELPLSPINAYFSLGVGYTQKLEPGWSLYVKANYDFQVNSSFTKAYPIRKTPRAIGFTVGLWWK